MPALFTYPLYHTPFLEERNSITENFIIISLKFFCIHAFIDLAQGFVAVIAEFFKCFRIFRLEIAIRPPCRSYTTTSLRPSPCSRFDSTTYPAPAKIPAKRRDKIFFIIMVADCHTQQGIHLLCEQVGVAVPYSIK